MALSRDINKERVKSNKCILSSSRDSSNRDSNFSSRDSNNNMQVSSKASMLQACKCRCSNTYPMARVDTDTCHSMGTCHSMEHSSPDTV